MWQTAWHSRVVKESKKGHEKRCEGRAPSPSLPKSDLTYPPFCVDAPRDPGYEQSGGPTGAAWPNGCGLPSGFDGIGRLSRPFPWEGSIGWIACPSGPG